MKGSIKFSDQHCHTRESIGDCALAGDKRWAGTFGVNVDFVARSHCSVAVIAVEDVQVVLCFSYCRLLTLFFLMRTIFGKDQIHIFLCRRFWRNSNSSQSSAVCKELLKYS